MALCSAGLLDDQRLGRGLRAHNCFSRQGSKQRQPHLTTRICGPLPAAQGDVGWRKAYGLGGSKGPIAEVRGLRVQAAGMPRTVGDAGTLIGFS